MSQVSISVDVDIEDYLDEVSDRALIAEVNERMMQQEFARQFSERACNGTPISNGTPFSDDTQRIMNRLAEEIACGDTSNALDTLRAIFPSLSTHNAIGFAHRASHRRHVQ